MADAATAEPRPDPNEKLVKVFDAEQESEALVVRGLLDSAGIDADMTSIDAVQEAFPVGGVIILVREEDAERARQVIADFRQSGDAGEDEASDETAEIDITGEPPAKA